MRVGDSRSNAYGYKFKWDVLHAWLQVQVGCFTRMVASPSGMFYTYGYKFKWAVLGQGKSLQWRKTRSRVHHWHCRYQTLRHWDSSEGIFSSRHLRCFFSRAHDTVSQMPANFRQLPFLRPRFQVANPSLHPLQRSFTMHATRRASSQHSEHVDSFGIARLPISARCASSQHLEGRSGWLSNGLMQPPRRTRFF